LLQRSPSPLKERGPIISNDFQDSTGETRSYRQVDQEFGVTSSSA
jgi:hypothetical protein